MAEDPLPDCDARVLCNGQFCADTCVDGSVKWDPWIVDSIRFQYNLTRDRSFKFGPILGTHNAFISRANGFGLTEDFAAALYSRTLPSVSSTHVRVPNQRYGPTDLLNVGVRELEFDIYDLPDANLSFNIYMCHSPVPDPESVIAVQAAADALGLGQLNYNPFTELCSPNLTLKWAMTKVANWSAIASNTDQVVALFLDNRVASWNAGDVATAITSTWGSYLMTPSDVKTLFNGIFPSRSAMIAAGESTIISPPPSHGFRVCVRRVQTVV